VDFSGLYQVGFQKKTPGGFLVGLNYINPEDNYGPFDFLSQISKLSYFNVLGLADFMLYHCFPFRFLC